MPEQDWLDGYAGALRAELGDTAPALVLDDATIEVLLDLARLVAHGSERRFAPLSTFLAGQYVAGRVQEGVSWPAAAEEARTIAQRLLDQP